MTRRQIDAILLDTSRNPDGCRGAATSIPSETPVSSQACDEEEFVRQSDETLRLADEYFDTVGVKRGTEQGG